LNRRLLVSVAVVVAVIVAGGVLVVVQQGATTSAQYQPPATLVTGGTYVNTNVKLQLRLSVNASFTGGTAGTVTIQMKVDEFNTFGGLVDDVQGANLYALNGLSLSSCGNGVYPFGVAIYIGKYTATNVSLAAPLRIYPTVPCPLDLRNITAYLFQPDSDLAQVLPSSTNATTPMLANVTATSVYGSSTTPLGPGTYTVAAGDEWGSLTPVYFTIGTGTTSSTTSSTSAFAGLGAQLVILSASSAALPISALFAPFARRTRVRQFST
jgi:hypothetical protein